MADAAHQLRTPLAGLQAQVEAAARAAQGKGGEGKSTDATITLATDKIIKLRSATRRTSQLANQLLALSRFYQVLGTVGEGNGLGLGLAIADEIARVHKTQLVLADAKNGVKSSSKGGEKGSQGLRVRLVLQQENPHPAA